MLVQRLGGGGETTIHLHDDHIARRRVCGLRGGCGHRTVVVGVSSVTVTPRALDAKGLTIENYAVILKQMIKKREHIKTKSNIQKLAYMCIRRASGTRILGTVDQM